MSLPFSQACENNKDPILSVIGPLFADVDFVLEIGSGTGQHAAYFAQHLPHLRWQPTDQRAYLDGIRAWLAHAGLSNLLEPLELDVRQPWPVRDVPAVFSANTVHIMHWPQVVEFFTGLGQNLRAAGLFCLYGPFNYHGEYTSASNERFDGWLRARDPGSGIRDIDDLQELGQRNGLELVDDYPMPANNRLLHWIKSR